MRQESDIDTPALLWLTVYFCRLRPQERSGYHWKTTDSHKHIQAGFSIID